VGNLASVADRKPPALVKSPPTKSVGGNGPASSSSNTATFHTTVSSFGGAAPPTPGCERGPGRAVPVGDPRGRLAAREQDRQPRVGPVVVHARERVGEDPLGAGRDPRGSVPPGARVRAVPSGDQEGATHEEGSRRRTRAVLVEDLERVDDRVALARREVDAGPERGPRAAIPLGDAYARSRRPAAVKSPPA
jgi:hypothetical protein